MPYFSLNSQVNFLFAVLHMVGVAQWSEHWTVAPGVGGSSPLTHPKKCAANEIVFWVVDNVY